MFNKVIVLMFAMIVTGACIEAYNVISMVSPALSAYDAQIAREASARVLAGK